MQEPEIDIQVIRAFVSASDTLVTWSLSVFGATFVCLLGTSYAKPVHKRWKLIYLNFIPAWIFLALSVYRGYEITRLGLTAEIAVEPLFTIFKRINSSYFFQLNNFYCGLAFLGVWLAMYLAWWLLNTNEPTLKTRSNED